LYQFSQWDENGRTQQATCDTTIRMSWCWGADSGGAVAVIVLSFVSLFLFCMNMYYLNSKIEEMEWSISILLKWALLKAKNVMKYGFAGFHFSVNVTKRALGFSTVHLKVKRKNDILFREITIHRTDTLFDLHKLIIAAFVDHAKTTSTKVKQIIKNSEVLLERDEDIQRLKSQDSLEVELENANETKLEEELPVLSNNSNNVNNV
jgi:hypothetical protein